MSAAAPEAVGEQSSPDAKMRALLASMGVDVYEPRVLHQLLEYMHLYVTEVFADAAHYAQHAGRTGQLECEDVQLAARLKGAAAQQASAPQLLDWIASARNREALTAPSVPNVQLPNPRLCLVQENWQLEPADGGQRAAAVAPAAPPRPTTAQQQQPTALQDVGARVAFQLAPQQHGRGGGG